MCNCKKIIKAYKRKKNIKCKKIVKVFGALALIGGAVITAYGAGKYRGYDKGYENGMKDAEDKCLKECYCNRSVADAAMESEGNPIEPDTFTECSAKKKESEDGDGA